MVVDLLGQGPDPGARLGVAPPVQNQVGSWVGRVQGLGGRWFSRKCSAKSGSAGGWSAAALCQLEQQRARGQVLELPGGGSPVPPPRQFPAEPPATPTRLGRQPALRSGQLFGPEAALRNPFRFVHLPQDAASQGQSSEKMKPLSPAQILANGKMINLRCHFRKSEAAHPRHREQFSTPTVH